jgi:hypothetical protein
MATLDGEIRATFSALPADRRKVVSSHDAFAYFGRAYGIHFIAPVGVSTDAEPSAGEVGAIIRQIRKEKIKAMFVENITDPRLLERISHESGARIGGTLYSDSLAKPGSCGRQLSRHDAAERQARWRRHWLTECLEGIWTMNRPDRRNHQTFGSKVPDEPWTTRPMNEPSSGRNSSPASAIRCRCCSGRCRSG